MKKMRLLSLALVAVMLCSVLAGCGATTVMKIGDANISKDVATAAISYADLMFQQTNGFSLGQMLDVELAEGQTGADLLKQEADGLLLEIEAVNQFAKSEGVLLEKKDKDYMKEAKKKQIEASGGKKEFLEALKEDGINEAFYDAIITYQHMFAKVYSELFTGEGKYAPTAEELASLIPEDYFCVKHVLVMAKDTDADFAEKKAKAEDIAKRAKAGEDFDALVAEFGEDPGMESSKGGYVMNTQGYTTTGGRMVDEFTEASVALADGGVSDIVKSDYGFHIIKRYPLTAEHIATDIEGFSTQLGTAFLSQKLLEFSKTLEVEYTAAYDKMDLHKIFGTDKPLGADADAESHEGHDHEAEGEIPSEELPEITLTPAE